MSYLKTILTYHMPSEAEVDKSLLEATTRKLKLES
jgi:hypothetical protein